jgi:hypothetical protein
MTDPPHRKTRPSPSHWLAVLATARIVLQLVIWWQGGDGPRFR